MPNKRDRETEERISHIHECHHAKHRKQNVTKREFTKTDAVSGIQAIIDSLPAYVIILDEQHRIVAANKLMRDKYGKGSKSIENAYCQKLIHGTKSPYPGCPLEDVKITNKPLETELFDKKSSRWLRSTIYPMNMTADDGRKLYLHTIFDITDEKAAKDEQQKLSAERKRIEAELRNSEERFRAIVEQSKDGIIMEDQNGNVILYNDSAQRIFGYSRDEINEKGLFTLVLPKAEKRREVIAMVEKALKGNIPYVDLQFTKKDSNKAWVSFSVTPLTIGNSSYNLAIVTDITARKEAEELINYMAYYDVATGLPNKTLLIDRLSLMVVNMKSEDKPTAVLYAGIDNFKAIIDILGHDLTEDLLREVSERIKHLLGIEKTLAYLGNGEFVILMPCINHTEEPARLAALINETLKPTIEAEGHEIHVSASFGISLCPDDGINAQELLKNADIALSRAKEKGSGSFEFFETSMNLRSTKRLSVEGKLHRALENNEFILYYQPQIDLKSNEITGLEALIRWQSPELGFVSPMEFIGIAEDAGLIVPIGEWVLRTACMQNKEWQKKGFPALKIGVNLSPRQFKQKTLANDIKEILKEAKLDPSYLELEITESLMMEETDTVKATLDDIRNMNIKLALDDFGTGYSSLAYLQRFPINRLKIDKIFIDTIGSNEKDKAIARSIISVAHVLGMSVVAEGVETEDQLEILRELECDEIQGYLFSKPLPATGIESLLINNMRLCA
jgi:PAS domain S-box-containing protein/diguanylate cyclase (GGDEF)-like protein